MDLLDQLMGCRMNMLEELEDRYLEQYDPAELRVQTEAVIAVAQQLRSIVCLLEDLKVTLEP